MSSLPDPPQDASLRDRLWCRFWSGWHKALLGLVVLVAVAWGSRPGDHRHRARLEARMSEKFAEATASAVPGARVDRMVGNFIVIDDWFLWTYGRCFVQGPLRSIGAFGYVWVLD